MPARCATVAAASGAVLLDVKDLEAKVAGSNKAILRGVSLTIREGEVHAIMGKNGSGKSTLSKVLVGHPDYEVTGGSVTYKGNDLLALSPEERSHQGLFLSFQSPVEIPGVRCVFALSSPCDGCSGVGRDGDAGWLPYSLCGFHLSL